MKFQVEFNDLHEDENQLEKLGCTKEIHEEYTCYTKNIENFEQLKEFQAVVEEILDMPYVLLLDMDWETPIIYLQKVNV